MLSLLRYVKILLVLSMGLWGLIGTIGNLANLQAVYDQVLGVTTMAGVPEDVGPPWRTGNALVAWTGVVIIVLGKLSAFLGGAIGGVAMLRAVNGTASAFSQAKHPALAGIGLAFALTFLGFTVVGESAFFMFYAPTTVGAAELAFRFSGSFALIGLFVGQAEPG
jgi:predicted small integral membrane protein